MKSLVRLMICGAAFALSSVASAGAAEMRLLSSWDESYPVRSVLIPEFIKNVEAATNKGMTFTVSGPETVPAFEQLQPSVSGVFQFLVTHGAYHFGTSSYLVATEGFAGDLAKWREVGLRDEVDKHYQTLGLKLVALPRSPEGTAYQVILRAPVTEKGDLQGRKIRGTQNYSGMLSLLGASPVVLAPSEIYSSLEKGVIDGAAWPVIGVRSARWNEVAKFLMRPTFGTVSYPILMNLRAWNALPDSQKQMLLAEGRKIEDFWFKEWSRLAGEEQASLLSSGSKLTEIGEAYRSKLVAAWAKGAIDVAMSKSQKDVTALQQFAKQHGLLP